MIFFLLPFIIHLKSNPLIHDTSISSEVWNHWINLHLLIQTGFIQLVLTSSVSLPVSTCRWRTLPGSAAKRWGSVWRPVPLAHCPLSMRPLYLWGKDSISQQTSPPWTQSGQCSRPTAHEWEPSGWLKTPLSPPRRVSFFYFCFFFSLSLFSPFSLCCFTVSILITPNTDHSRLISPSSSQLPHWFTACNVQTYTNCDPFNNAKQSCKNKKDINSQERCQGDTITAEWKDCPDEKYLLYSQTVTTPSIWSSPPI